MTPEQIQKTIEYMEPIVRKQINASFNDAFDIVIGVVQENYIYGHTVVNGVLDNIINQIKKLKEESKISDGNYHSI